MSSGPGLPGAVNSTLRTRVSFSCSKELVAGGSSRCSRHYESTSQRLLSRGVLRRRIAQGEPQLYFSRIQTLVAVYHPSSSSSSPRVTFMLRQLGVYGNAYAYYLRTHSVLIVVLHVHIATHVCTHMEMHINAIWLCI